MPRINNSPFNVGDRVRINSNCVIPEWIGLEGVIINQWPTLTQVWLDENDVTASGYMQLFWETFDLINEPIIEEDWS